jgi:hypothetical protein
VESELVAHIGEVDERRLSVREASSSMFAYRGVLPLEAEAYLQFQRLGVSIAAARDVGRRADSLTGSVAHLYLSRELQRARSGVSPEQARIEELIAELAPSPMYRQ